MIYERLILLSVFVAILTMCLTVYFNVPENIVFLPPVTYFEQKLQNSDVPKMLSTYVRQNSYLLEEEEQEEEEYEYEEKREEEMWENHWDNFLEEEQECNMLGKETKETQEKVKLLKLATLQEYIHSTFATNVTSIFSNFVARSACSNVHEKPALHANNSHEKFRRWETNDSIDEKNDNDNSFYQSDKEAKLLEQHHIQGKYVVLRITPSHLTKTAQWVNKLLTNRRFVEQYYSSEEVTQMHNRRAHVLEQIQSIAYNHHRIKNEDIHVLDEEHYLIYITPSSESLTTNQLTSSAYSSLSSLISLTLLLSETEETLVHKSLNANITTTNNDNDDVVVANNNGSNKTDDDDDDDDDDENSKAYTNKSKEHYNLGKGSAIVEVDDKSEIYNVPVNVIDVFSTPSTSLLKLSIKLREDLHRRYAFSDFVHKANVNNGDDYNNNNNNSNDNSSNCKDKEKSKASESENIVKLLRIEEEETNENSNTEEYERTELLIYTSDVNLSRNELLDSKYKYRLENVEYEQEEEEEEEEANKVMELIAMTAHDMASQVVEHLRTSLHTRTDNDRTGDNIVDTMKRSESRLAEYQSCDVRFFTQQEMQSPEHDVHSSHNKRKKRESNRLKDDYFILRVNITKSVPGTNSQMCLGIVNTIAMHSAIRWIEHFAHFPVMLNENAASNIQGGYVSYKETKLIENTSCSYSSNETINTQAYNMECINSNANNSVSRGIEDNRQDFHPLWSMGINGSNEIVLVTDSGVDYKSCYFADDKEEISLYPNISQTHRKIISYHGCMSAEQTKPNIGDQVNGHGTHVAGSALGATLYETQQLISKRCTSINNNNDNTSSSSSISTNDNNKYNRIQSKLYKYNKSSSDNNRTTTKKAFLLNVENNSLNMSNPFQSNDMSRYNGVAIGAKMFMEHMTCGSEKSGYVSIPGILEDLYYPGYDAGARIGCSSWGFYPDNAYSVLEKVVDRFIYENDDLLLLFASGNNVNKGTHIPGTAKNVLTVGSHLNSANVKEMNTIAATSSWGKVYDERIKPELVGPGGMSVYSARSSGKRQFQQFNRSDSNVVEDIRKDCTNCDHCFHCNNNNNNNNVSSISNSSNNSSNNSNNKIYKDLNQSLATQNDHLKESDVDCGVIRKTGTSMANGVVSGGAALLRQYLREWHYITQPSSALLKAALIHSTVFLSHEVKRAGYGRVDLSLLPAAPMQWIQAKSAPSYVDRSSNESSSSPCQDSNSINHVAATIRGSNTLHELARREQEHVVRLESWVANREIVTHRSYNEYYFTATSLENAYNFILKQEEEEEYEWEYEEEEHSSTSSSSLSFDTTSVSSSETTTTGTTTTTTDINVSAESMLQSETIFHSNVHDNSLVDVREEARLLKITLVWTDSPAAVEGATKSLVNDLDLMVVDVWGHVYYGNAHIRDQNDKTIKFDRTNNVEQIRVELSTSLASEFRVIVFGNKVINSEGQQYALVVSAPGLTHSSTFTSSSHSIWQKSHQPDENKEESSSSQHRSSNDHFNINNRHSSRNIKQTLRNNAITSTSNNNEIVTHKSRYCPNNCSSHGICDFNSLTCNCSSNYSFIDCSLCNEEVLCSGHGVCNDNTLKCTCDPHSHFIDSEKSIITSTAWENTTNTITSFHAELQNETYENDNSDKVHNFIKLRNESFLGIKQETPACSVCQKGWYGPWCNSQCKCAHGGICNTTTGLCMCIRNKFNHANKLLEFSRIVYEKEEEEKEEEEEEHRERKLESFVLTGAVQSITATSRANTSNVLIDTHYEQRQQLRETANENSNMYYNNNNSAAAAAAAITSNSNWSNNIQETNTTTITTTTAIRKTDLRDTNAILETSNYSCFDGDACEYCCPGHGGELCDEVSYWCDLTGQSVHVTHQPEGWIEINGYHTYPYSVRCGWQVIAPPHHKIVLEFTEINLEKGFDALSVFEMSSYGNSSTTREDVVANELVRRYTGEMKNTPSYTSRRNVLFLLFESDWGPVKEGFKVHYKFVEEPQCNITCILPYTGNYYDEQQEQQQQEESSQASLFDESMPHTQTTLTLHSTTINNNVMHNKFDNDHLLLGPIIVLDNTNSNIQNYQDNTVTCGMVLQLPNWCICVPPYFGINCYLRSDVSTAIRSQSNSTISKEIKNLYQKGLLNCSKIAISGSRNNSSSNYSNDKNSSSSIYCNMAHINGANASYIHLSAQEFPDTQWSIFESTLHLLKNSLTVPTQLTHLILNINGISLLHIKHNIPCHSRTQEQNIHVEWLSLVLTMTLPGSLEFSKANTHNNKNNDNNNNNYDDTEHNILLQREQGNIWDVINDLTLMISRVNKIEFGLLESTFAPAQLLPLSSCLHDATNTNNKNNNNNNNCETKEISVLVEIPIRAAECKSESEGSSNNINNNNNKSDSNNNDGDDNNKDENNTIITLAVMLMWNASRKVNSSSAVLHKIEEYGVSTFVRATWKNYDYYNSSNNNYYYNYYKKYNYSTLYETKLSEQSLAINDDTNNDSDVIIFNMSCIESNNTNSNQLLHDVVTTVIGLSETVPHWEMRTADSDTMEGSKVHRIVTRQIVILCIVVSGLLGGLLGQLLTMSLRNNRWSRFTRICCYNDGNDYNAASNMYNEDVDVELTLLNNSDNNSYGNAYCDGKDRDCNHARLINTEIDQHIQLDKDNNHNNNNYNKVNYTRRTQQQRAKFTRERDEANEGTEMTLMVDFDASHVNVQKSSNIHSTAGAIEDVELTLTEWKKFLFLYSKANVILSY